MNDTCHYLMCVFGHCLIVVSIWSLPCWCIWSLLDIYNSGEYLIITLLQYLVIA